MQATQDEIVTSMEGARISYLAIIGTLGPMIGLVGTIAGMIASFQEMRHAAMEPNRSPEKVAEGISTALFITLEGVSLSVPARIFFALFRNRIALMAMETPPRWPTGPSPLCSPPPSKTNPLGLSPARIGSIDAEQPSVIDDLPSPSPSQR